MLKFNPLDHPVSFSGPLRLLPSDWVTHIPFAMFLVSALRPRVLVELGTFNGVSYCAFCQAAEELHLDTVCRAVDTWQGNVTGIFYDGDEILKDLKIHHDSLYGKFSSLTQNTFDEAADNTEDGTVDLLHINGSIVYESVKRDFETWLPKMSERGVLLFHNINERKPGFGVWRLWEELRQLYPYFEFTHEQGLGLLVVGSDIPQILREFLAAPENEQSVVREFFIKLGQNLKIRASNEQQLSANQLTIAALSDELTAKETHLNTILNTRSWRLANRLGRIKIRYFEPFYEKFIQRSGKHRKKLSADKRRFTDSAEQRLPLAPKDSWTDNFKESLVLLSEPDRKQLSRLFEDQAAAPLHKPDIICFSIVDWDFRYQRPQQLMSQFAANGHRVFFIKLKNILPQDHNPRFSLKEIRHNLYEVTLAAWRLPRINQEIIGGYHADSFLDSLDSLRAGCLIDDAIGYVMTPSWKNVAFAARNRWNWRIIYDCMDEWEGFPGILPAVSKGEKALVRECDLLIVTAVTLQEKWRTQRETAPVLVRNGVDFEFYAKRCQPNDLLDDDGVRPVIGYYGAIADWFDLELMIYIAEQRPQYSFVLLGGVFDVDVSRLEALPNVKLLGQQPYATMPQYLYHFDVCLIPFKLNAITHATDPVKLYEYLSAGKPVVSVALAELQPFADYLYIAQNKEEFLEKLDKATAEDDSELKSRRIEFARLNTWKARYEAIVESFCATIPRAGIIIVTYNNLPFSKLCLESVVRNTEYLNYEIIVVDNNSSDGTPEFLREFAGRHSNVRLILNSENQGFAKANNQGIAISTGERIVLLNNDTVVSPGWLSRLLAYLDDPQIGMVGPVTNFVGNEAKIEVDYQTWSEMEKFALRQAQKNAGEASDIFMLAMFCVALRRDTYELIGALDERFGIGMFEDDDYAQRIKAAGFRVVCATDVFVHHFGQSAFKKLIPTGEYEKLFEQNRRLYEEKWKVKWIPHKHGSLTKYSSKKN